MGKEQAFTENRKLSYVWMLPSVCKYKVEEKGGNFGKQ